MSPLTCPLAADISQPLETLTAEEARKAVIAGLAVLTLHVVPFVLAAGAIKLSHLIP